MCNSLFIVPGVHLSVIYIHIHTKKLFSVFSYFILYHEGKMSKSFMILLQLNIIWNRFLHWWCLHKWVCDPKEANTNHLCCQVMCLPACCKYSAYTKAFDSEKGTSDNSWHVSPAHVSDIVGDFELSKFSVKCLLSFQSLEIQTNWKFSKLLSSD